MPKVYFSQYKSPNIIIDPSVITCYPPSPKRPKIDSPQTKQSPQHVDISFLDDFNIDEIVSCLQKTNNRNQHSKEKEISINKKDVKLDLKPEESDIASPNLNKEEYKIDETNNDNNNGNTALEKSMDNIQSKLLTLKGDLNASLSFKFTELAAAEINKSDYDSNSDHENYIRIKINIDLVSKDNLKTNKCMLSEINNNVTKAENKAICFSKNNTSSLQDKVSELETERDNVKTEPINVTKKGSAIKSIVLNRNDIYLSNMLEKRLLKFLHMKYHVLSILHYGEHSKIFKCKNLAGEEYAVKMLNCKTLKYIRGSQKQKMLTQIQSDIPKENLFCTYLHGSFTMKGNWCFLMEFYPKNLKDVIMDSNTPLNIHVVQELARQLVAAVMLLRHNNIVHSDIKPSHILLNWSNDKLKLCGFDKAYYEDTATISPCIGTLNYRAPEVILGYSAGFSIDVWATGLVLHEMATGRKLFPSSYSNGDMLYKQMSTLGNMPPDMIATSCYGADYFIGNEFHTNFGFIKKRTKIIYHFTKKNKIKRSLNGSYFVHWAPSRTKNQQKYDMHKISLFVNLLQKMIVLHPNRRLTIEFVYANRFIYN